MATATGSPVAIESVTPRSHARSAAEAYGATRTSIVPPQVSPTPNASSSLIPYDWSCGVPEASTSPASSYTAPSTQPPETLPATAPPAVTAITAPGDRGALPRTETTVARANGVPASCQARSSGSSSRTASTSFGPVRRAPMGHTLDEARAREAGHGDRAGSQPRSYAEMSSVHRFTSAAIATSSSSTDSNFSIPRT